MKKQLFIFVIVVFTATILKSQNNPYWMANGNPIGGTDGVTVGTNFLGTAALNPTPIVFRTNGVNQMILQNGTGFLGIGGLNPNNRLDVFAGDIDVNAPRRSYMIADRSVLWHKGANTNIFVG